MHSSTGCSRACWTTSRTPIADFTPRFMATALVTGIALPGCTVHAPLKSFPDTAGDSLAFARSVQGSSTAAWPDREWWTTFGDAQLSTLIKEGLAGNPDMDAALARLNAAEARAAATRAPLIPSVDANVGV